MDRVDSLTNVGKHPILVGPPGFHDRLMSYDGEPTAYLVQCPVWLGREPTPDRRSWELRCPVGAIFAGPTR